MAMVASIPHQHVKYPSFLQKKCPFCFSRVKFAYPGRKRSVRDLNGEFKETRYYYRCTNDKCVNFAHPFNPAPKSTISEKKYSNSVWKWIGREAKIYNANASQIHARITETFNITISENTIRNIIDEIDCYLEGKIDEQTKRRVKSQGKIVLSLDGQKPADGASALWLFVDLISDRVLDVQILDSADHITLHKCVDQIVKKYDVKLAGILSDKQGSIVKMHQKYYSQVPHQYCQFHFLQNIWNFLEIKDSTLQKQLAKTINSLQIVTRSKDQTVQIQKGQSVNYRQFFAPIEKDLRKLIKNSGKKFEILRGVKSYLRIQNYSKIIQDVISTKSKNHRITKILTKCSESLEFILEKEQNNFLECSALFADFKEIQQKMGIIDVERDQYDKALAKKFQNIWNSIRKQRKPLQEVKAVLPHKNMNIVLIKEQWYRLFKSYRSGLTQFYNFPGFHRTNSQMEQKFGQEKMKFVQRSGKPNVSRQIRVRGHFELKLQYTSPNEVKSYIHNLVGEFNLDEVRKGLENLREMQKIEQNNWNSMIGGRDALENLFTDEK